MATAAEHDIEFVDLVCVNLYPFEATARRRGATEHEIIENIDIGGPTMIRAAAKNYPFTAVVVNPASYDAVLQELKDAGGKLSLGTRESLAVEAFSTTARYDSAISRWFVEKQDDFAPLMLTAYEKVTDLSYGENPHQRAAYYADAGARMHVLSMIRQLGGKDLSFNNVLDLNAARLLMQEFELPACVIIKHNNPCGVAVGGSVVEAYHAAFACDPLSAFGGVIAVNRAVDTQFAEALLKQFCEVIIAPHFSPEAIELLSSKPNMRILEDGERRKPYIAERDVKRVMGGLLVQDRDMGLEDRTEMEVVTDRKPTEAEWGEMLFAWKVCKHVRSNAIVLSNDLASVGIGAGQMSRVDSVRLAIEKAGLARLRSARRRDGLRRLLPVPGRPPAGHRRGRHRDHPAGRLKARPRSRRGRRRGRHLDGLHAPPPLQALAGRGGLRLVAGHPFGSCRFRDIRSRGRTTDGSWRRTRVRATLGSVPGMEATTIARLLALGRMSLGGVLTVTPGFVTKTWVGEATPGAKVLGAGFGARDVAIGAGLWRALDAGEDARPWLLAGAASDAADLLATLAAGGSIPRLGRAATVTVAAAGAGWGSGRRVRSRRRARGSRWS